MEMNRKGSSFQEPLENKWLQKVKRELGDDFVERILRFEQMEPSEFKEFNERLKQFVQDHQEINPTRMRKVYEVIRNAEKLSDLLLGLPKLAYMVGKEEQKKKKDNLGRLYVIFAESVNQAGDERALQNIRKFAEALVAYHKFYSTREM